MSAETSGLESIVGSSGGRVWYLIIESLVGGDPVDAAPHARVVEHAEAHEGEDQVAGEAGDDLARESAAGALAAVLGEAA